MLARSDILEWLLIRCRVAYRTPFFPATLGRSHASVATATAWLRVGVDIDFYAELASPLRTDSPSSDDGARVVYLLRSAQYQFFDCGVRYDHARRSTTCIEAWDTEGNMAKKAKKAKAKKTAKKAKKR